MTDSPIDPHAAPLEFLPYPQTAPAACRSTRHCADHGFCHRCQPRLAATMSSVNEAIQRTDPDQGHWGPLYAAIGQALRNAEQSARTTPDNPLRTRIRALADEHLVAIPTNLIDEALDQTREQP